MTELATRPRRTAPPASAPTPAQPNPRVSAPVHPLAWWIWSLGLATAATTTTNPLLLIGLIVVAIVVVDRRKPPVPWARSFGFLLRLACIVVLIRVTAQVLVGTPDGAIPIIGLPGWTLPSAFAGMRVGGDVMLEPLLFALYQGLRLAAIIVAIGAAATLASPHRLLRSIPTALYEVGVSIVIAATFLPQLVMDVARVRAARRLRGRKTRGIRALAASTMPVLHGAVDRSVILAAAMDCRGYGRTLERTRRHTQVATMLLIAGVIAITIGLYLIAGTARDSLGPPWGFVLLALGAIGMTSSFLMGAKRNLRSRYRPETWHLADTAIAACGVLPVVLFALATHLDPAGMTPATQPPVWPSIPIPALIGLAIAGLPAFLFASQARGAR